MPSAGKLAKPPGLDVAGRKVRLELAEPQSEEQRAAVRARLVERTGFDLE